MSFPQVRTSSQSLYLLTITAFTSKTSETSTHPLCPKLTCSTNRSRTPKWALKAGLIDTSDRDRRAKKNQWAKRFDERNNESAHVGQALEAGEVGDDYVPVSDAEREREARRAREGLWDDQDAEYYNNGGSTHGLR